MNRLLTTDELLDDAQDATGLLREQLLLMVAKSALVRHLATGPQKDLFVLKGGTLLHHVFRSPRQSIRDADYTYLDPEALTVPRLADALRVEGKDGFYLDPDEAQWKTEGDLFEGKRMLFTIDEVEMIPRRGGKLDISVSIRKGERLDPPEQPLIYTDPLLAYDSSFPVNGLTLEELAAEKVLGWVARGHLRHYLDLAYIAREFGEEIDTSKTADLIRLKFAVEKKIGLLARDGINTLPKLAATFRGEPRMKSLRDEWEEKLDTEVFFISAEEERDPNVTLADCANVEEFVTELWIPVIEELAATERARR